MSTTYTEKSAFCSSKAKRDAFCENKDVIIEPIISNFVQSRTSSSMSALLMPALYGKELYLLHKYQVPMSNIYAIEQNSKVHQEIVHCQRPERSFMQGIRTTPVAMTSNEGIQYAYGSSICPYDLVYLDFFSYPSIKHYSETLRPLFRSNMLKPDGMLILTFAKNRTTIETKAFNEEILAFVKQHNLEQHTVFKQATEFEHSTGVLVLAALANTKYAKKFTIETQKYVSEQLKPNVTHNYFTTIVKFG